MEPLSREHRDTKADKYTQPIIYSSQFCDTRSGLRAGKIKVVVTVYNKTIKISCFILSYHIVINYYSLSLMLPVRYFDYNCCVTQKSISSVGSSYDISIITMWRHMHPLLVPVASPSDFTIVSPNWRH